MLARMSEHLDTLRSTLSAVRERTLELVEPLSQRDMHRSPDPILSPPVWDLGHIAAYEELWLTCTLAGRPSLHPDLQRTYDAFETPRAARAQIRLLDEARCRDYLDTVRERSLEVLDHADLSDDAPELTRNGFVFEMVAAHEAQHSETVLQALQMYPDGTYQPRPKWSVPSVGSTAPGRVDIPAGDGLLGAAEGQFSYDCERPQHRRHVAAFAIDRVPVSNGRYMAFVDDQGYHRRDLWSSEGWEWRTRDRVEAPLYWTRDSGNWHERQFDEIAPIEPARPVCHVSCFEAEAYARWAGGRLPTEAEWERAARHPVGPFPWGDGHVNGHANLDQLGFGTAPVGSYPTGAAPSGCLGMIGDVWEWTSTPFAPYPGFRAFPYREYAEVFFGGDYRVLRGGSWATQPVAARTTFRNWDHPYRRQIFAGFRLAWDGE